MSMVGAGVVSNGVKSEVASVINAEKVVGGVTKMSLKVKIAIGTAAAVLVGGTIGLVSLIGNNGDDTNDVTDNRNQMVTEDNNQTLTEDDTEAPTDKETEEMVNWFRTAKWNKDAEGIKSLFVEGVTLPINLEDIDEIGAPYDYFFDVFGKKEAQTIQDILNDTDVCDRDIRIWPMKEMDNNIHHIEFFNYREKYNEELSAKQCYDENWWYIFGNMDALLISEDELPSDYQRGNYDAPFLDVVAEKYGAPSYILMILVDDNNPNEARSCHWYYLVYEYDEYVVVIDVQDQPMPEYNTHVLDVEQVTYYTRESWDKEMENKTIASEKVINGVTCKFKADK